MRMAMKRELKALENDEFSWNLSIWKRTKIHSSLLTVQHPSKQICSHVPLHTYCTLPSAAGRTGAAFKWSSLWICLLWLSPQHRQSWRTSPWLWSFHVKGMPFILHLKYTFETLISISLQIIPRYWLTGSKGSVFHLHSHDGNSRHNWTLWHQQN